MLKVALGCGACDALVQKQYLDVGLYDLSIDKGVTQVSVVWHSELGGLSKSRRLGYSTGKITGRATNTVPVPVNTVPVAVRVRYNRTYPRCNRFTRGVKIPAGRW